MFCYVFFLLFILFLSEHQDESVGGGLRHENRHGDKTPAEKQRSTVRQEETHKGKVPTYLARSTRIKIRALSESVSL